MAEPIFKGARPFFGVWEVVVSVTVSRILHAGYLFESDNTRIAFDPIFENPFSRNCFAFPPIKFDQDKIKTLKCDAIFISHFHDDHCSLESLNLLDRHTPIYMYCVHDEFFSLIRNLGFTQVFQLKLNVTVEIGPFKITTHSALDRDVDSIFQIQTADLNILNIVDSWIDPDTFEILSKNKAWHLILWPFQMMREIEVLSPSRYRGTAPEWPTEWIEQLKLLKPQWIVPSSCQFLQEDWSWYNQFYFPISYKFFEQLMQTNLPEAKTIRMNPGARFLLDPQNIKPQESLDWIHPIGDQNVDYSFNAQMIAPPTQFVAQKFAPLTTAQRQFVIDYCQSQLMIQYKSFDHSESEYFAVQRTWRLSIFDHQGQGLHFYFKVGRGDIELILNCDEKDLEWTTEIPINKMHSAIQDGEALSSMYVRINDRPFSTNTESELKSIDFLEDPLLRCLFSSDVASFQRAQLAKCQNIHFYSI